MSARMNFRVWCSSDPAHGVLLLVAGLFVLFMAIAFLASCTALGLTKPTDVGGTEAYAQAMATSVRKSADALLVQGAITSAQAQKAQDAATATTVSIAQAKVLVAQGNTTGALAVLNDAVAVLSVVQTQLKAAGGK